jgi:hypothetical protein
LDESSHLQPVDTKAVSGFQTLCDVVF